MKRSSKYAITGLMVVSGIALACEMKAMPYLGIIDVSAWDIAVAAAQGYDNPLYAAAVKNLDQKAIQVLGASEWKDNNYIGPFSYKFAGVATVITYDKPCDKNAIQTAPRNQGSNSSGSSGGYNYYGGRVYGGGSCLYGCGGTVTVGEVDPV